jgi:hypothetical protein
MFYVPKYFSPYEIYIVKMWLHLQQSPYIKFNHTEFQNSELYENMIQNVLYCNAKYYYYNTIFKIRWGCPVKVSLHVLQTSGEYITAAALTDKL